MSQPKIGNVAAAVAICVAFAVGLIGSLAIRPTGGNSESAISNTGVAERIRWRLPVAFQTSMPVLGDNPIHVTNALRAASGGAINLQIFEPNEVVPAFGITDAVRDGKVEAGYTWLGYDQGKTPASALIAAVPFGMEPWEYTAWWYDAGGRELGERLYQRQYNVHPLICGLTGPETAGWFRRPIRSLDDVRGLKIRFAGLGGKVMERLGASVTILPGGEIFQALEKGAIDATEFSLPSADQLLGFHRIAPFNYYPGWHQPSTAAYLIVNLDVWRTLDPADRQLIETACTAGVLRNLSRSEASQGSVIANFPNVGVSAENLPMQLLRKLEQVTEQILSEEARRDSDFKEIFDSQQKFLRDYAHWKTRAYLPRDF